MGIQTGIAAERHSNTRARFEHARACAHFEHVRDLNTRAIAHSMCVCAAHCDRDDDCVGVAVRWPAVRWGDGKPERWAAERWAAERWAAKQRAAEPGPSF